VSSSAGIVSLLRRLSRRAAELRPMVSVGSMLRPRSGPLGAWWTWVAVFEARRAFTRLSPPRSRRISR